MPLQEKFKAGDIVQLKSGGPKMTVKQYIYGYGETSETVFCQWFDGNVLYGGEFHHDSLDKMA